jgi:fucose permease
VTPEVRRQRSRGAPSARLALVLSFLAFVSLGLPDGSLGVAWPTLRASFAMPLSALGTLLAVSIAGTLVSSAASGALLERVGVGRVLMVSTLLVTASAAMLASSRSWSWAMASALVGGFGAGAVDAGVNAHAAVSFSARSMTWLHATYGVGAMLGPVIMTTALGSGLGWRKGYAALAALLTALTLAFALNQSLWASPPRGGGRSPDADAVVSGPVPPRIAVGLGLFFVYTGLEAACGQWAYSFLTETGALDARAAGLAVAAYWGALGAGRVAFGALAGRVGVPSLVRAGVLAALASAVAFACARGAAAAGALVALGFALAPIYPLSMSSTPRRVGAARASRVIGWQVSAAYLGVASWPLLGGLLAERFGVGILGAYLAALALVVAVLSAPLQAEAAHSLAPDPQLEDVGSLVVARDIQREALGDDP